VKQRIVFWVEKYFYDPALFERFVSLLFLPLSFLYCLVVYVKFVLAKEENFGIKIVSVGNLTVGGSGKTPLVTALASHYKDTAVVLRGYGRRSTGTVVVKADKKILCDVSQSGDEAMVYAKKLEDVTVIVSEDRKEGIKKAKEYGAKIVFLDDGYSKHSIKKLDLVLHVNTKNNFCLPSGPYREKLWKGKKAHFLYEEKDFKRKVVIKDPTPKMVLVTAIARPQRLDSYLPDEVVAKYYFEDHYDFKKEEIQKIIQKEQPSSLLVTLKDYVKLEHFGYPLSLMDLDVEVEKKVFDLIKSYS